MTERVQVGGLQVAKALYDFINNEAIPGTGIAADKFWAGAEAVINELAPKNRALLAKRDELQAQIDGWAAPVLDQTHVGEAAVETYTIDYAGPAPRGVVVARTPAEHAELGIDVKMATEATEIDINGARVKVRELETGAERWEGYDQLMIGTGATPVRPPIW